MQIPCLNKFMLNTFFMIDSLDSQSKFNWIRNKAKWHSILFVNKFKLWY